MYSKESITPENMVNLVGVSVDRTFDTFPCMPRTPLPDSLPTIVFGIIKCHLSSDKTYLEKLCPATSALFVFILLRDYLISRDSGVGNFKELQHLSLSNHQSII